MPGRWLMLTGLMMLLAGCSSGPDPKAHQDRPVDAPANANAGAGKKKAPARESSEDRVFKKGDTPDEQRYMEAGKSFILAVARNDPTAAYACFSSHAKAQMQLMQFKTPVDEAEQKKIAKQVYKDVSAEKFAELVGEVVRQYGEPKEVRLLYCFKTDPHVLSGAGEPLDTLFAIGGMPKSVPAAIRRASLRGQVTVKWKADELAAEAKESGMTEEEILKEEDGQPYFNLKFVLVEENGELKVGYFEFMPPSMMD
jgi:hypothetical protein